MCMSRDSVELTWVRGVLVVQCLQAWIVNGRGDSEVNREDEGGEKYGGHWRTMLGTTTRKLGMTTRILGTMTRTLRCPYLD